MKKNVSFVLYLSICYIFLSCFSGIFGYLSSLLNINILRLWKEIFLIILLYSTILINGSKNFAYSIKILFFMITSMTFYLMYSISDVPISLIIYQYKVDYPIVLSIILFTLSFKILSKSNQTYSYLKIITKVILFSSLINSLAIFFQHFFANKFYSFMGIEQLGTDAGVKIITQLGEVRAIGFLTGFVPAGELMLISIIILIESRNKIIKSRVMLIMVFIIFTISLIFTGYKNGIIGLIIYFVFKLIEIVFKDNRVRTRIALISCCFIFIIQYIISCTWLLYNKVNQVFPQFSYNSIYLRVIKHEYILNNMVDFKKFFFGLGYGYNGTGSYAIQKSAYGINAVALDSTFIHLMSNMGFIGVIVYLAVLIKLIIVLYRNTEMDLYGVRYLAIYLLIGQFFYNNITGSIPGFIIICLYGTLTYLSIKS